MSHEVNAQIKEQLYDDCSNMTVGELSDWLEKNGKVLSVGKLANIINVYCETEFDKRAE